MTDTEVEVQGERYRVGRLPPMTQFHLVRRMGAPLAEAMRLHLNDRATPGQLMLPVMEAIGKLSDEDAEYIVHTCLGVVSRHQRGSDAFAPVQAPGGRLMFEDISMPVMMQLTFRTLEAQLTSFFPSAPPQASNGAAAGSGPPFQGARAG